jgi:photosystem II stability/assembly factor-like uncharacterized protein
LLVAFLLAFHAAPLAAQVDPELLSGMKARSIGPAGMSGRIAAIEGVESNPNVIYVGAATGGVWKSENAGLTWKPIFDDQPVHSIGALAVFQPNPDIVWVGTGESNTRNSVSVGDGIYKSLDAGHTWTRLGLAETERIYRILLHPTDPDVAYVAALGRLWGENPERGVFKTTDGGKTWKKILYVDERTGCADLAMDPANPNKLIAALWEFRRWPWFFRSGGPSSGLYVTIDAGETWEKRTVEDGLPEGELGRIGVAFSRAYPNIVYALVEAKKNVLLRSEDGGRSWKKVNEKFNIAPRPFYYADLRVDPEFPNRVYNLHSLVTVSNDSGKTFETLVPFRSVHPDHHALWINPRNARHLVLGNDGGVAISHDRGATWRFVGNLPLAQYYHIRVDTDTPYNVYGGMQDNGSWRGPSSVWENGGIRNHHWDEVGFGDGFDTSPDPEDSMRGYAMSQEGYLVRWNLRTGERKDIRPPAPEGVELRFNWNAGFAQDPFEPATIYYGSQFLHKSTDRGESWSTISPDLTTNNPDWQKQKESGGLTPDVTGAENFTTIIAIAPSPIAKDVLWVGTDDGRLHVTRDGGKTWASVEKNVKGVPANTWIPHITPSRFDAGTAYVVFDNHRRSDFAPYIFKTTDHGKNWNSLMTAEVRGYALALAEDTVSEDLLFLGTEFGLFVSQDGGKHWFQWKHGFPTASAMDLVVHPRQPDLIVGTHGRAAYVLDDISPLRTLTAATQVEPIHLFPVSPAQQYRVKQTGAARFPGEGEYRGENRPYGALLTFSLNFPDLPHPKDEIERERKEKERQAKRQEAKPGEEKKEAKPKAENGPQVELQISDAGGQVIRTFKSKAVLGVNRATWDLRRDAFKEPSRGDEPRWFEPVGPEILPGTYSVTIKYKDQEAKGSVDVVADPRFEIARADREAKWNTLLRAGAVQETLTEAIERIRSTHADIEVVSKKVKEAKKDARPEEKSEAPPLVKAGTELSEDLTALEKRLWVPPDTKGYVAETDPMSKVENVLRFLGSSWDAPTPAQMAYLREAEELTEKVLAEFNQLFATRVADYRKQVEEAGIALLPVKEPVKLKKE